MERTSVRFSSSGIILKNKDVDHYFGKLNFSIFCNFYAKLQNNPRMPKNLTEFLAVANTASKRKIFKKNHFQINVKLNLISNMSWFCASCLFFNCYALRIFQLCFSRIWCGISKNAIYLRVIFKNPALKITFIAFLLHQIQHFLCDFIYFLIRKKSYICTFICYLVLYSIKYSKS